MLYLIIKTFFLLFVIFEVKDFDLSNEFFSILDPFN